jgi:hypothetical protein
MTLKSCSFEKEIAPLLTRGQWPQAGTPELRAHVSSCSSCADLVLVTLAFQSARASAAAVPNLPSPGVLWWRAQLRRRNAAVERVGRPMLGAQIFAMSITLLLVVGLVISQATQGLRWLSWLGQIPQPQFAPLSMDLFSPAALFTSGSTLLVLIPVLATVALLSGVVVYLASEKQ